MINKDSILSVFNAKGTLLKWLKTLNDKLDDGQLESVTVVNQTEDQYQLSFNFADDSHIVSDALPILRGEKGEQGIQGPQGPQGPAGADGANTMYMHSIELQITGVGHFYFHAYTSHSTITEQDAIKYIIQLPSSMVTATIDGDSVDGVKISCDVGITDVELVIIYAGISSPRTIGVTNILFANRSGSIYQPVYSLIEGAEIFIDTRVV